MSQVECVYILVIKMKVQTHSSDCVINELDETKVIKKCPPSEYTFETFSRTEATIYKNVLSKYNIPGVSKAHSVKIEEDGAVEIELERMDPFETLVKVLNYDHINEEDMRSILFQIFYTLYCFEKIGLVHNDLHSGNVFIKKLNLGYTATYVLPDNTTVLVPVNYKTYIYDFDRSTIEFEGAEVNLELEIEGYCDSDIHTCVYPFSPAFDLYRIILSFFKHAIGANYNSIIKDLLKIIPLNLIVLNYLKVENKSFYDYLNVDSDITAEKAINTVSNWFPKGKNYLVYSPPPQRTKSEYNWIPAKLEFKTFGYTLKNINFSFLYLPNVNKNFKIIKEKFPELNDMAIRLFLSVFIRKMDFWYRMVMIYDYKKEIQDVETATEGMSFKISLYDDMISK